MADRVEAIHCINQFFGGLGGEEQAGMAPQFSAGVKGPGRLIHTAAPEIEIVGTIVFGDNFVAENPDEAVRQAIKMLDDEVSSGRIPRPALVLAGPAFQAGRYGMACGALCSALQEHFAVPAVTAMYAENPGVDAHRKSVCIVRCSENVMGMPDAVEAMARVALKLVRGKPIRPEVDGTIPRGLRQNIFAQEIGAVRAIEMLMHKLRGETWQTEYAMPEFDRVPPASAVPDVSTVNLALITSGGIVPRGNPDRIESASAQKFGEYSLDGLELLTPETHQTVHGGYDPTYANADPNRVLPLDAARQLEREGRIGRLHDRYFATVGNATSVDNAKRFGKEIAAQLVNEGVQAVILTST